MAWRSAGAKLLRCRSTVPLYHYCTTAILLPPHLSLSLAHLSLSMISLNPIAKGVVRVHLNGVVRV